MSSYYRNSEGYWDATAGAAMTAIAREERKMRAELKDTKACMNQAYWLDHRIHRKIGQATPVNNATTDELVYQKAVLEGLINSVSKPEFQALLELRYICFQSWEQIAEKLGCSIQDVFRLHDKALREIAANKKMGGEHNGKTV